MGMLSRLLNPLTPGRKILGALDPAKGYQAAMGPMQEYYNQAQGYMMPYMQQGQQAYQPMSNAMNRLLNPQDLQNEWIQGYQTSPYANALANEAQQSGLSAASSMGLLGSSPALQALQAGTSRIVAQDRDNYLNNLMQKYMTGAQMAQGLYGQGSQMASMLGQNAMNQGQMLGQMAYGKQASRSNMLGGLLGAGAGALMGGPMGALAGSAIGQQGQGANQMGMLSAYNMGRQGMGG